MSYQIEVSNDNLPNDKELADLVRRYFEGVIGILEAVAQELGDNNLLECFVRNSSSRHILGDIAFDDWVSLGQESGQLELWEQPVLEALQEYHQKWCRNEKIDPAGFGFNVISMDPQALAEILKLKRIKD